MHILPKFQNQFGVCQDGVHVQFAAYDKISLTNGVTIVMKYRYFSRKSAIKQQKLC